MYKKPGPVRAFVFAGGWKGEIGLCLVERRVFEFQRV